MRGLLVCGAAGAALFGGTTAVAAERQVQIEDAVARVVVIPEDRADVKVEFLTANPRLPLRVVQQRGRTVIKGDLSGNDIRECRVHNGVATVKVRRLGEVGWNDMPQVIVRTPRKVGVGAGGAVFGSVGRSDSVNLGNAGCGDWTVANTDGALEVSIAGSGDVRTGTARSAAVKVAGSGDVATGQVRGPLNVSIAGSGDVTVASVSGEVEVKIAGSGDVAIGGGRASAMRVSTAGSGDVSFEGEAGSLRASLLGSGDVRVVRVSGPVDKSILGSGEVSIGH